MPDLNIFGIGLQELVVFVVILLLLFGPNDLTRMAKQAGRFINRLTRSENYQAIQRVSAEMQNLPRRIVEEAQLEDLQQIGQQTNAQIKSVAQDLKQATEGANQQIRETAQSAAQTLTGNPAPSPKLSSEPPASAPLPASPPPPPPADPPFTAWTQELDDAAKPAEEPFSAWTRETKPPSE
ncbi:MAG: twin-arginine translocase TatA/TatE family subunit [Anaerolineales bacterium]